MKRARDIRAFLQARLAATDETIDRLEVSRDNYLLLLKFVESSSGIEKPKKLESKNAEPYNE